MLQEDKIKPPHVGKAHLARYYGTLLSAYRWSLAGGFTLAACQALLILPMWWLAHYIFTYFAPRQDPAHILWAGVWLIAVQAAQSLFGTWTRYQLNYLEQTVSERLHTEVLETLVRLPRSYFLAQPEGQLAANLLHDLSRAQRFLQALLAQVLPALLVTAALSLLLLWLQFWLFVGLVVLGAGWAMVNRQLNKRLIRYTAEQAETQKEVAHNLSLFIGKIDLVRVQTAEAEQLAYQRKSLAALTGKNRRVARWHIWHGGLQQMLLASINIGLLAVSFVALAQGWLAPDRVLTLYAAIWLLRPQMQNLAHGLPNLAETFTGLEDLYAFLTTDAPLPYTGRREIAFQGRITFENVSFGYEATTPILANLSLTLEPGTTTVLLGPNGVGKTTVINLLLGFHRPQQGRLLADGVPYDELDIIALRRQIGTVLQEGMYLPHLATVREQLMVGCPDTTPEEMVRAAQQATAHDFIAALPEGYETSRRIGLQLFSGGQRQRLFLTRALLRRPKLLILDEPANHLDAAAAQELALNLQQLPDAPTLLIISHNLAFDGMAQQVIRLPQTASAPPAAAPATEIIHPPRVHSMAG